MNNMNNMIILTAILYFTSQIVDYFKINLLLKTYKNIKEEYNIFKNAAPDSNIEYLHASYLSSLEIAAKLIIQKFAKEILKTWFNNISEDSFDYIYNIRDTKNPNAYENIIKLLNKWKITTTNNMDL